MYLTKKITLLVTKCKNIYTQSININVSVKSLGV
jgi:hypothetical protein